MPMIIICSLCCPNQAALIVKLKGFASQQTKLKSGKKIHSGEALDVHCKKRFEHPYNGCTDRSNNFELSLVSADQSPRISRDRKHTLASTATDI